MELTPQTSDGLKVEPGRRSFLGAMFAMSAAAVSTLLAIPLVRFSTFPLRKAAAETWFRRCGTGCGAQPDPVEQGFPG